MAQSDGPRWSVERACAWWDAQPWRVGCNFIPSHAINQLEMWQADSFDLEANRRELSWAAGLGFNLVRVYLHDLVFETDREGFLERLDAFLAIAAEAGVAVMFVFFDDVWNPAPRSGPQPAPIPGRHNSGWVQSPGLAVLDAYAGDTTERERLEAYVRGVLARFGEDGRVLLWDLYNEPGGYPSPRDEPVGERCLPLLRDVFRWARDADPSQPITSGLWWTPVRPAPESIGEVQRAGSDVVSFHHYGPADELVALCDRLRLQTQRPLLCSEYLARQIHSRFETHLPIFRERRIGAISWGLVVGRTQTIYPWWSWFADEPQPEPQLWFHDVLHADGTPHDKAEVEFLRKTLLPPERLDNPAATSGSRRLR